MAEFKGGTTSGNYTAAACFVGGATAGLCYAEIPWIGALVFVGATSACLLSARK